MICNIHGNVAISLQWKVFDRQRLPFFRRYGKKLTPVLQGVGRDIARLLERGRSADSLAAAADDLIEARLPNVYDDLYKIVIEEFGDRADEASKAWDPEAAEVRSWVRAQTARNIRNVADSTRTGVKRMVLAGLSQERGLDDIARQIRNSYTFSDRRAFRIARTEVVAASNAGNHFGTIQNLPNGGRDFEKVWSNSRDLRVRDTHRGIRPVPAKDLFRLPGGSLMFPGDSSHGARASEIVNCRCTSLLRRRPGTAPAGLLPPPEPTPPPPPRPRRRRPRKPKPAPVPSPEPVQPVAPQLPKPKPKPRAGKPKIGDRPNRTANDVKKKMEEIDNRTLEYASPQSITTTRESVGYLANEKKRLELRVAELASDATAPQESVAAAKRILKSTTEELEAQSKVLKRLEKGGALGKDGARREALQYLQNHGAPTPKIKIAFQVTSSEGKLKDSSLIELFKKDVEDAASDYTKLINVPDFTRGKTIKAVYSEGRAYFSGASIKSEIHVKGFLNPTKFTDFTRSKAPKVTTVHELGHWLEHESETVARKSNAFLTRRTLGEKPRKLSDLQPGRYRSDEVARPDKFENPYIGKSYSGSHVNGRKTAPEGLGQSIGVVEGQDQKFLEYTEVVSMGMEQLYADPIGFAKRDPDYFEAMLDMLGLVKE